MVSSLSGRWVVQAEGDEESFVMVSEEGEVNFIGDPDSDAWLVASDSPDTFVMRTSDGEELCTVRLVTEDSFRQLKLKGPDGTEETWHQSCDSPKVVRRSNSFQMQRKFTKEGQAGSDQLPAIQHPVEKLKAVYREHRIARNAQDDGRLSAREVGLLLRGGGEEFSDKEVALLFQQVDQAGSGRVDFDTFVEYVFGTVDYVGG
jgi:hypothetical protein